MKAIPLDKLAGTEASGPLTLATVSPEELKHQQQVMQIRTLAAEIVSAYLQTGEKWYDLCVYIRKEQIAPKVIRSELKAVGFHKVQISKLISVAHAPDDIWNKYEARTLGFKKVLALSRGAVEELKQIDRRSVDESAELLAEHMEDEAKKEAVAREEGKGTDGKKDKAVLRQQYDAAKQTLIRKAQVALAAGVRIKSETFDLGGRVSVTVRVLKAPRVQPASSAETNKA
jgi:hypothetical protein